MKKLVFAAAALTFAVSASIAGPAEDREAMMKSFGGALGQLGPIAKGEKPFDAAAVAAAIEALNANAMKFDVAALFPAGSGVGAQGPDHLTFDLADSSKISLSFYGKRPGPGMKLEKLSMQFSTQETEYVDDVLEAYERLILDAMRGDHTLFTTAQGIESLWERSAPLLVDPPPVKMYQPGTWGPNAIHQLIAPHAWRLPFERVWREKKS